MVHFEKKQKTKNKYYRDEKKDKFTNKARTRSRLCKKKKTKKLHLNFQGSTVFHEINDVGLQMY